MKAMKDADLFFDPTIGVVLQNYLENRAKYLGSGNYNEEGFAYMEKAVPGLSPMFARALKFGILIRLGTDGVVGVQGQNASEGVCRVSDGGKSLTEWIVSDSYL